MKEQRYCPPGNPKDKVSALSAELSSAQARIAQLEALARSLESDKDGLLARVRDAQRMLAERDEQLDELMGEWDKLLVC